MNYKLPVKPSPLDGRDWKASAIYKKITLPETLDLRSTLFKVRDQGDQGSCVAMAGACMKEWQEVKDVELDEYMSPQFIYNNREDLDEEGMYLRDLMQILQKMGDCKEAFWPYGRFDHPSEEAYDNALDYLILNYAQVNTVDELKTALYKNGVCVIAVPVYNWGTRMWRPEYEGQEYLGGHCMAVVGYNKDGFIIRNSWGAWGNSGYCTFPYEDWGMQWEQWTSIDADSYKPDPPKPKSWFKWWYIPITIAVIVGLYFLLR